MPANAQLTVFAVRADTNGVDLRIQEAHDIASAPCTQLGWSVTSVAQMMQGQDEQGIWTAPGGARITWFRDPDGNLLSLAQSQEDPA